MRTANEVATVGNLLNRVGSLKASLLGGPKEFHSSVNVLAPAVIPVEVDFTKGKFAAIAGELLKATGSLRFDFQVSLGLGFTFGVNTGGEFYIKDPSLNVRLSVNDDPLPAINADQKELSASNDRRSSYRNGQVISLSEGDSEAVKFTVVGDATFDADANQTKIIVAESIDAITLTHRIRPTFDLGLSMYDLISARIDDGVMDLNVEFSLVSKGEMVRDSHNSNFTGSLVDKSGNALQYRPTFSGTNGDTPLLMSYRPPEMS